MTQKVAFCFPQIMATISSLQCQYYFIVSVGFLLGIVKKNSRFYLSIGNPFLVGPSNVGSIRLLYLLIIKLFLVLFQHIHSLIFLIIPSYFWFLQVVPRFSQGCNNFLVNFKLLFIYLIFI